MSANLPGYFFWVGLVVVVAASYWWNPRRRNFQNKLKRYAVACFVDAMLSYVFVITAAVLVIENPAKLEKNSLVWIFVAIGIGAIVLREIAKRLPVLGVLLVEFDNAAAVNQPPTITQKVET